MITPPFGAPDSTTVPVPSPFGSGRHGPARRIVQGLLWLAAIAAAVVVTMRLTRRPRQPAALAGHVHGAAAPAADSARTVTLTAREAGRIGVTFADVTVGPLQRNVRTVAQVTFDETRIHAVTLRVDGYVEQLYVDFLGQPVRAGEPLLRIYSPMLVSAQQEYLIARQLEEDVANSPEESRLAARHLVASARQRLSEWSIPERELERLESTRQVQRAVTLDAPASGVIVEKTVLAGQRVMAGDPLYRIADLSEVWLEGEVFEQDLPAVRVGQRVTAEFQALPGDLRSGTISYIYPTLNRDTRTARIRVVLANPRLQLKPGMFATIWFDAPTGPNTLTVPRSAVMVTGERNLVFVRRPDGRFTPRDVVLGSSSEDRVEILKGLSAGETVVASGTFLVDAESNLGTLLGGMGDMPGMDMTAPGAPAPAATPAPRDTGMAGMPGMNHGGQTPRKE